MKQIPTKPSQREIDAAKSAAKREFDRFLALSDAQKTRAANAAARRKSRPLSPAEKAMFDEMEIGRENRASRTKH